MNILKKKWKELVYSVSTEDHYAEYDPNDTSNFNMARRANQGGSGIAGSRIHLTSTDGFGDEEMNIGVEDNGEDINIDEYENADKEGVSEALLAWRHIESWTTEHNPDLNASLGDPCTENDITHAEEDLEITIPAAVKVSLRVHDGQEDLESMTGVSGLIYGLQLMTLDQIVEMTEKWRSVAKNLNKQSQRSSPTITATQSTSSTTPVAEDTKRRQFKLSHIPVQTSIPKDAIQPVYAHPAWIPLVTDNAGNHIGVDLAPAEQGKYAQVIIFGRDFDTKFVVAENWGDFLLSFANDLEAGNWYLIDDSDDFLAGDGDLVFRDKKSNGPAQDYLEVLKRRALLKAKQLAGQHTSVPAPSETATEVATTTNSTYAETDGSQLPEVKSYHDNITESQQQASQVDDVLNETEAKSKDLSIPAMEVTNETTEPKGKDGELLKANKVQESQGKNEVSNSKDEGEGKLVADIAPLVEEKLKIDDEKPNPQSSQQKENSEEQKKGSEIEDKDDEHENSKSSRKEEFESVVL